MSVTKDQRLNTAIEAASPEWLPIVIQSYGIPEVVGENTAIAAILKDVEAYLASREIDRENQPAAARQISRPHSSCSPPTNSMLAFFPTISRVRSRSILTHASCLRPVCQREPRRARRRSMTLLGPSSTGFIDIFGNARGSDGQATCRGRISRRSASVVTPFRYVSE